MDRQLPLNDFTISKSLKSELPVVGETPIDDLLSYCISLIQSLIQQNPCYGSETQDTAARIIEGCLKKLGWQEVERVAYVARDLAKLADFVEVDTLGENFKNDNDKPKQNVIAFIDSGSPGPTLIINGHYDVDTVTAPEKWRKKKFWKSGEIDNGLLYGRGATDMLSGLVAGLVAASMFAATEEAWRGKIIFLAVTDEEVGGNGTVAALSYLEKKGHIKPDKNFDVECVIPEPTSGRAFLASLGFIQCRVTAASGSGHVGGAGENAFTRGNEAMNVLQLALRMVAEGKGSKHSADKCFLSFGVIRAGEDPTLIPASFLAEGVMLYPAALASPTFLSDLIHQFEKLTPHCTNLEFGKFHIAPAIFETSELYKLIKCGKFEYLSANTEDDVFSSPCDARIFRRYDINTIICGPGDLTQAHAIDEFIRLSALQSYLTDLIILFRQYLKT